MVNDFVTVRTPIAMGAADTSWSATIALIPPCAWPAGPTKRRVKVAVPTISPSARCTSTSGRVGLQRPTIGLSGM